MPTHKIKTPIEPGFTYHIYNRGSNYQNVFLCKQDYLLFLEKLKLYLADCCSFYAFALMPNHYHLLLKVNDTSAGSQFSKQFTKCILSYTNIINRREGRNGSLFLSYFRRIKIVDDDYLKKLVYYINHNPVKHGITEDYKSYNYSSYRILVSDSPTGLKRNEVMRWFGGQKEFINYHSYLYDMESIKKLSFEE